MLQSSVLPGSLQMGL